MSNIDRGQQDRVHVYASFLVSVDDFLVFSESSSLQVFATVVEEFKALSIVDVDAFVQVLVQGVNLTHSRDKSLSDLLLELDPLCLERRLKGVNEEIKPILV
jgi:hypothetical protein